MQFFKEPLHFEWDAANRDKNLVKHRVTHEECEEAFFDPHKRILGEPIQVGEEERYLMAGCTKMGRGLFVVLTIRKNRIRVISARDLNKKERRFLA